MRYVVKVKAKGSSPFGSVSSIERVERIGGYDQLTLEADYLIAEGGLVSFKVAVPATSSRSSALVFAIGAANVLSIVEET